MLLKTTLFIYIQMFKFSNYINLFIPDENVNMSTAV